MTDPRMSPAGHDGLRGTLGRTGWLAEHYMTGDLSLVFRWSLLWCFIGLVSSKESHGNLGDDAMSRSILYISLLFALLVGCSESKPDVTYSNIHSLCQSGNGTPSQLHALLRAGRDVHDVNAVDEHGLTALHYAAAYHPNPDVAAMLVLVGADVNARDSMYGMTPLHFAAEHGGAPEVISVILKAGADVNARDEDYGATPLHFAAEHSENQEVILLLLEAGADVTSRDPIGETVLDYARRNESIQGTDAFNALKAALDPEALPDRVSGLDPDVEYASLHALCESGNATPESIQAFLDLGASVNAVKGKDQLTPLHQVASSSSNPAVITGLVKGGADVNAKGVGGFTPLHFAALSNGAPGIASALLAAGADVNARLDIGDTPLHMAASTKQKNPDVILILLSAGAEANIKNESGETPLDAARRNMALEGTKSLEQLKASSSFWNRLF